ncbi:MAG: ATP-binding cassette domain-containing protein [Bacilli bacterium]|jgi:multiple sugar transport system ATP-binding protein
MSGIVLKNVNVTYKTKTEIFNILNNVSVALPKHQVTAIIGASGCGKTTLLKAILGLVDYEGEILFDNTDLRYISVQDRVFSYVSQNFSLFPKLTTFNNIAMPLKALRISGDEVRARVHEVARLMKISECLTRKPKDLSEGQCQRVAIARSLIKKPNAYFFDEPFSALDGQTSANIIQEMKAIFTLYHATVVFVCHDVETALLIGDYFVIMDEGMVVEAGTKEQVIASDNPIVKGFFFLHD